MHLQTRGIILKQVNTVNDKKMITLFSERYGKISVGAANDYGRSKTKSSLAYRFFTLGNYDLYKKRDNYTMSRAEVVRSFFRIGEDVDRYMEASYVLEFTDRLLVENEPAPAVFQLLTDYFEVMEKRPGEFSFLTLVYQIKAINICGFMPRLTECSCCGKKNDDFMFNIESGGAICSDCAKDNGLIYKSDSAIINKIRYIAKGSIHDMGKIYLEKDALVELIRLIRKYIRYHLDIYGLKSEVILQENNGGEI